MLKQTILALAATSMAVPMATPAFEAQARHHTTHHHYRTDNGVRYWRGNNGRYYCHRKNGTVGLLVGGAAGALVGSAVSNGHTAGTVIGAAAGALLGRSVARNHHRAYCR
jgi:outer membrane lipoprotein SlyB